MSEVHGAKFLEFDKAMRRDNLSRAQVKDQITGLDRHYQVILRSFADGINTYIAEASADPGSKLPAEFKKAAALSSLSVNVYFADTAGNIGYFHQGKYPKRSAKANPLFPAPGTGEYEWQGFQWMI